MGWSGLLAGFSALNFVAWRWGGADPMNLWVSGLCFGSAAAIFAAYWRER